MHRTTDTGALARLEGSGAHLLTADPMMDVLGLIAARTTLPDNTHSVPILMRGTNSTVKGRKGVVGVEDATGGEMPVSPGQESK